MRSRLGSDFRHAHKIRLLTETKFEKGASEKISRTGSSALLIRDTGFDSRKMRILACITILRQLVFSLGL